jgi:hypothetical protein
MVVEENEQRWSNVKVLSKLMEEVETLLPRTSLPNASRFVDEAVREKLKALREDLDDEEVPA